MSVRQTYPRESWNSKSGIWNLEFGVFPFGVNAHYVPPAPQCYHCQRCKERKNPWDHLREKSAQAAREPPPTTATLLTECPPPPRGLLGVVTQVSIGIVARNKEAGIGATLDSLLAQSIFRDAKEDGIIIVDDSWRYPENPPAQRRQAIPNSRKRRSGRPGVANTDAYSY